MAKPINDTSYHQGVPALVLLNGMPSAGKSTLAYRLVQRRPMALNLDIDIIRHQIGHWLSRPTEAGLAARGMARAMAKLHLSNGFDVVVPQFLGRPAFIGELETVAGDTESSFHHIMLDIPLDQAVQVFERRQAESNNPIHADAARLLNATTLQPSLRNPLARYHELLRDLNATCPPDRTVPVIDGDVDGTLDHVLKALREFGLEWSDRP